MAPHACHSLIHTSFIVGILYVAVTTETTIKRCFKGTDKEPTGETSLTCPQGSVIRIGEALLGRNEWSECLLTEEDCVHPTRIFEPCDGVTSCNETFKTYSARCGYITILLVSYDCIPVPLPEISDPDTTRIPHGTSGVIGESSSYEDELNKRRKNFYGKETSKNSDSEDEQEVGLLVATILASIITGVMLVIAILMTIRRLLNYPTRLQRREGENPSRFLLGVERACFHVDKLPCFSGHDSLEETSDQAPRSGKSTNAILSSRETLQSCHRSRMTPIGQEASDGNQSEDTERGEDQEGSETPGHARTTSGRNFHPTLPSFLEENENVKMVNLNSSTVDDNRRNKTCNWMDKSFECMKTINNNNNILVKTPTSGSSKCESVVISMDKIKDNNIDLNHNNNSILERDGQRHYTQPQDYFTGVDNTWNSDSETGDFGDEMGSDVTSKYTAIVVPNTESSSRC